MKIIKTFIILFFISLILSYIYNILFNNHNIYTLKIGFPFIIYYELNINKERQYSYLLINLIKNIIIILLCSIIVFLFSKKKKT